MKYARRASCRGQDRYGYESSWIKSCRDIKVGVRRIILRWSKSKFELSSPSLDASCAISRHVGAERRQHLSRTTMSLSRTLLRTRLPMPLIARPTRAFHASTRRSEIFTDANAEVQFHAITRPQGVDHNNIVNIMNASSMPLLHGTHVLRRAPTIPCAPKRRTHAHRRPSARRSRTRRKSSSSTSTQSECSFPLPPTPTRRYYRARICSRASASPAGAAPARCSRPSSSTSSTPRAASSPDRVGKRLTSSRSTRTSRRTSRGSTRCVLSFPYHA